MNNTLLKCLPILALTFGLSACGEKATEISGSDSAPPALTAPTLNTTYQMDCDGGAPTAASDVAVNISACQFNSDQLAVLRQFGAVSVDANCASRSVKIKNSEGHVLGTANLKDDGTYEAKLDVAARFSKLAGCSADIAGTAAGMVTCTEDKKVANLTISTNYAFGQPETINAAVSRLTDEQNEGGQEKGKKGGGQVDDTPTQPIACVNFAPCSFGSSTALSCAR